jgi:hypothetical protein
MVDTEVCQDCIVTHLLDRCDAVAATHDGRAGSGVPGAFPAVPVVVIEGAELATLHMLQEAGMAPRSRHVSRHPSVRSRTLLAV